MRILVCCSEEVHEMGEEMWIGGGRSWGRRRGS